jgi:hypothetical protein
MHRRFNSAQANPSFAEETMKIQFKASGILMVAALLASILALPTVGRAQATGSNASLADTITWLTSFLPTATGATDQTGKAYSSSITSTGGCNLVLTSTTPSNYSQSYTFSLSDVNPASVAPSAQNGAFGFTMTTRSATVKMGDNSNNTVILTYYVPVGYFADQTSAQRAANAFQHAVQLCANAQPF